MQLQRKFDLSLFYWLQDNVPSSVNVEDGFPQGELILPTVSTTLLDTSGIPLELGGAEINAEFWRIDVFAKNKAQRDNLAYTLFSELEQNVAVYDYDEGFPPGSSPTQLGTLIVSKRNLRPVHVFSELVEKMYWRSSIVFYTKFQAI